MPPYELVDASRLCQACRVAEPPVLLVEQVIARRERLHMSRNQLAVRLGVRHEALMRFETRQARPTDNLLELLTIWLSLSEQDARLRKYGDGWPDDLVEFGRLVRERCEAAGLSLWALKVAAEVQWTTLQKLAQGTARWLRPDSRRRIINVLQSTPNGNRGMR